jgi:hypothetical protein
VKSSEKNLEIENIFSPYGRKLKFLWDNLKSKGVKILIKLDKIYMPCVG